MNEESTDKRATVAYPERSPLELIDEEKRKFSARRIFSTYIGGFRMKYDEAYEKSIHWSLILIQIVIYSVIPLAAILSVKL